MKLELFLWQPTLTAAMWNICMTTDTDGYHKDMKFKRKFPYHFPPFKVIPQKTKLNIECLIRQVTAHWCLHPSKQNLGCTPKTIETSNIIYHFLFFLVDCKTQEYSGPVACIQLFYVFWNWPKTVCHIILLSVVGL